MKQNQGWVTRKGYIILYLINKDGYGIDYYYGKGYQEGGSRRNKATPKPKAKPQHKDMTMKDIKEMCKANQIKLSKVVEGKRVVFKKKELITKLKRKKLLQGLCVCYASHIIIFEKQ